jgi:hypothetical protein
VKHGYYDIHACPITLVPDEATERIFRRHKMMFHMSSGGRGVLLIPDSFRKEDLPDEDSHFNFLIKVNELKFHYVTKDFAESKEFSEKDSKVPNFWREIDFDFKSLTSLDLNIHILGVEKYYEFICIPKYNSCDSLKMTDKKNCIRFKKAERISLRDVPVAFRLVTEEKIKMSELSDVRPRLWEVTKKGDRLISEDIPNPEPHKFSTISVRDTITTIFYY